MELGKLSKSIFFVIGGMSVLSGIFALILINIAILTGFSAIANDFFFTLIWITFMFAVITVFPKSSRSIGTRGLFLGSYLVVFIMITFLLGWMITPFP
ncbi:MAG: hypothetical protein RR588_08725 [Solibacillus sp.]